MFDLHIHSNTETQTLHLFFNPINTVSVQKLKAGYTGMCSSKP